MWKHFIQGDSIRCQTYLACLVPTEPGIDRWCLSRGKLLLLRVSGLSACLSSYLEIFLLLSNIFCPYVQLPVPLKQSTQSGAAAAESGALPLVACAKYMKLEQTFLFGFI